MNIKIRHFTKIIVLVAVVATLWYFHAKATTFGIVPGSSKDVHDCSQPSGASDNHARLHAEAYRSGMSTKFHSRGLRWLQKWRESEHLPGANYSKGGPLFDSNSGNSRILTDDPDSDQCSDVHKKAMADRCHFVNVTDDCQVDEGFIDYIYFVYCDFQPHLLPLGVTLLVLWLAFLFVGLAVTADDFFCPALSVISDTMRLSHNVAGVTFLAFGNGAPDIFSAIAAIGNAKDGDAGLAIGALFGAGVFVTTVVAGFIAIICPFDAMQRPFLRDVIFYLGAVFWTFVVLWDRKITKIEAIGFILLYIVYVVVVVVGRYIYTRQGRSSVEPRNTQVEAPPDAQNTTIQAEQNGDIQEPTGRTLIDPLDTVLNDESQPLLSNPDVISLTAVRNDSPLVEFFQCITPIDIHGWSGMTLFRKIYEIFKSPLMFFLIITVPVVNYEDEKHHWNRHLTCIQCVLGPVFGMLATKVGLGMIGGSFPIWALTLILGVMIAAVVFFTSKNDVQPKYHAVFAYIGFIVAVVWIYSIANEIVNILQTFGVVLNISNAILGLTLLAWGNSIGDFIADTVMARQGYPRMGISACFGGPLFNLLLGIGIPFTIATVKQGDYHIRLTLEELVLCGFLALSLISSLIIIPLAKFRMSRGWGSFLVVLYIVFLVVAILTEVGVIHADITKLTSL